MIYSQLNFKEFLDCYQPFPPVEEADEQGLLAGGGDLSVPTLLAAYLQGIFPWFNEGDPYLWWSPDPRMVLLTHEFKAHRSLQKVRRNRAWRITFDQCFPRVIEACASTPRHGVLGSWITEEMKAAYIEFHRAGFAHSVEVWQDGELSGGLYGVQLGRMFFGESMFSWRPDASKLALWQLCEHLNAAGFVLIDCQVASQHLSRLGAREYSRSEFREHLNRAVFETAPEGLWQTEYKHPVFI